MVTRITINEKGFSIGWTKFSIKPKYKEDGKLLLTDIKLSEEDDKKTLILNYVAEKGSRYIGTSSVRWGEGKNPNLKNNIEKKLEDGKVDIFWDKRWMPDKKEHYEAEITLTFPKNKYNIFYCE